MATNKDNELLAAYLVVGEDALKREAVVRKLKLRLEKEGDLAFNFDEFNGEGANADSIVSSCLTIPFASNKRLVLVENAEKLSKKAQETLVGYLEDPNPSTVLLIVAEKLAKSTRLYKSIASVGKNAVIDCAPPKRWELARQVRAMAVTHGFTITEKGAEALIELVGEDTVHIDNELKKLAVAHFTTDAVDERDVRSLVAQVAEVKGWEFVNEFSNRNLRECMRMLPMMPSSSPYSLLHQCVGRVRELICAKSLAASGSSSTAALAKLLKQPDWRVKNHMSWSRRFTSEELRDALISSIDVEKAMKSGADPDMAFREWVIETIG